MKLQPPAARRAASLHLSHGARLPRAPSDLPWVQGGNAVLPHFAFQVNALLGTGTPRSAIRSWQAFRCVIYSI